jgi:asparagine synthase (glutamine-hydrolysing)
MVRRRYLLFLWDFGDEAAQDAALRHLAALEGVGWRRQFVEAGWALALQAQSALQVRRFAPGRGLILGDLYPTTGAEAPGPWVMLPPELKTSQQIFGALSRRWWGRYVALHLPGAPQPAAALRDPSGSLECLTWRRDRLRIVASHLPTEHPDLLPDGLGLDWDAVGRLLQDSAAVVDGVALSGAEALNAGEMMRLGAAERTMIWTPAMFVSQRRAPRPVLHEQLRARVDQVVGAHARRSGAIVAEVSGGLDSAIVAGALQAASAGKVAQWVNFHTPDPEGDERRFARAVAARLAIPLVEAAKTELELTEAHLAVVGAGLRPGVAAIDYQYDEDNVARCAAVGADTLITGQGGDAVFLQTQTALMGADALRAGLGGRALFRVFRDVAAHRRASVWSVARRGFAASFSRATPWRAPAYLAKPLRALASPAHPWLADLAAVAPAKRLQIHALTAAQLFHGHSRRGEAVDLIHPLLSQPLVEFVLSVPSFDLALGANDRALAREAFADRLPGEVVRRRSKAELGAYYGRMLSRSLWLVRPYLLDGLLAGAGLVDRPFLEQALTAESLLWRELTPSLFELLAVEAWARNWDRLAAGRRG